jgi:hypothetical protein
MRPEAIRIGRGFAVGAASVAALLAATPALAQTYSANMVVGAMPLAVALGAGAFALLAGIVVRRLVREARASRQRSEQQAARLRTLVDGYEALISGMPEVIVLWTDSTEAPKLLGQPAVLLPPGRRSEAILDFPSWLGDAESRALLDALEQLQRDGHGFHLSLLARDGRVVRATGWALGGGLALRIRPAFSQAPVEAPPAASPGEPAALSTARTVLAGLAKPAFLRNAEGRLSTAIRPTTISRRRSARPAPKQSPPNSSTPMVPRGGKPHSTVVTSGGRANSNSSNTRSTAAARATCIRAPRPMRLPSPRCAMRACRISPASSMRWRRRSPSSMRGANWCSSTAPMRRCGGSIPPG